MVGFSSFYRLSLLKNVKKVVTLQPFKKYFVYLPKFGIHEVSEYQKGTGSLAGTTAPIGEAHAEIKDIRPFMKYFNELVATEVYNDVLFVSEKEENVWWYDGERIAFRTPNYTKILNAMRTQPTLTLAVMRDETGISIAAIQKLLDRLIEKNYVERGEKDGSWQVFVTQ